MTSQVLKTLGNSAILTETLFHEANTLNNLNAPLSPMFSSSNTKNIKSVDSRIPGSGKTNIPFAASTINTQTITVNNGDTNRTIAHLFTRDNNNGDYFGIRVSGSTNFPYFANQTSA